MCEKMCSNNGSHSKLDNKENNSMGFALSPLLFTEQFMSIKFVMKPCLERRKVRELIERGGGRVVRNGVKCDNAIHLVTREANTFTHFDTDDTNQYYFCDYVYDCCDANELLGLDKYRLKTTVITKITDESEGSASEAIGEPFVGISDYKVDERDVQLLNYIINARAFADISDNIFWTKALEEGITFSDSWETTKAKFFDNIMPNIDRFPIDDYYKDMFRQYYKNGETNSESKTENNSVCDRNHDIMESKQNNITIPDIIITPPSPMCCELSETEDNIINAKSDNTNEKAEESGVGSKSKEMDTNRSSLTQTVHESEQNKCDQNKNSISTVLPNQDESQHLRESSSESDSTTANTDNRVQSKYFEIKKTQIANQNTSTGNAYLEFLRKRTLEEEDDDESSQLQRIKDAMRVAPRRQERNVSIDSDSSGPSTSVPKCTFGAKIIESLHNMKKCNQNVRKVIDPNQLTSEEEMTDKMDENSSDYSDVTVLETSYKKKSHIRSFTKISNLNKPIMFYELSEDENILKFILESKRFGELKGKIFWEEAEEKNICDGRTWQSMKERFRKHIMSNIDKYDIASKYKRILKKHFYNERDEDISKNMNGNYTNDEDKQIIQYIVTNEAYDMVSGNKLWMQMQHKSDVNRSWQSMKERYRRRILPNLNKYKLKIKFVKRILEKPTAVNWFTQSEKTDLIKKCEKALMNSSKTEPKGKQKPTKRPLPVNEVMIDTDSE